MKILLLADYPAGYSITRYLKKRKENIIGLVLPKEGSRNLLNGNSPEKILNELNLPSDSIFRGEDLEKISTLRKIKKLQPDIILSIFWGFLLKPEFFDLANRGCINLHLSYLPYNRGRNPNVWPIVNNTPAGVTLHYIDKYADSGDIIAQSKVQVLLSDTGKSLYKKLVSESIKLFKKTWPDIKNGSINKTRQAKISEAHKVSDLESIDEIDLKKNIRAGNLINILRARTFSPFPAAYFKDDDGKKVFIRVIFQKEK